MNTEIFMVVQVPYKKPIIFLPFMFSKISRAIYFKKGYGENKKGGGFQNNIVDKKVKTYYCNIKLICVELR